MGSKIAFFKSNRRMFVFVSLFISVIVSLLSATDVKAAEQQILFCANQFRHVEALGGKERCQELCAKYNCNLELLFSKGWLIVSSVPQEVIAEEWRPGQHAYGTYIPPAGCTCIGTQYVLRKEDKTTTDDSMALGKEADLLKKEVDLLKKENELLKRENETLKQENESLKDKLKEKQKSKVEKR